MLVPIRDFKCPNCGANYKLVRAEADHQSADRQVECQSCGAPFHGREGALVLKYFLVERPQAQARIQRLR